MSSTEKQQTKRLIKFFHKNILVLATDAGSPASLEKEGASQDSFYVDRQWRPLGPEDFEIPLGSREETAATLDSFWEGTELAGLGQRIAGVSRHFTDVQQKSDVSSFIYEMF